ncbi:MAG: YcxB family protein [Burkholderiales bacterium]
MGRKDGLGPGLQDWAMPVVCLLFCVAGVFMLYTNPADRTAWAGLAFFALCALVLSNSLLHKLRRRQFEATRVDVVEGVPIRAAGAYMLVLGIGLTVAAAALLAAPVPWVVQACAVVTGAAGLWLLGMTATGRLRQRFLQFDPAGLTVGEGGFQYRVAWDNIVRIAEFDHAGVLFIGLAIADEGVVPVTPAAETAKALKLFDRNRRTMGAHIVLAPMHFGLDSGVLVAAIATRVDDERHRRADMAPTPALGRDL